MSFSKAVLFQLEAVVVLSDTILDQNPFFKVFFFMEFTDDTEVALLLVKEIYYVMVDGMINPF